MLLVSRIKEGSQARENINEATIKEYADHLTNGGTFPPIVVFFDSKDYWLADGWHRLLAHKRIKCTEILEEVKLGSQRDALQYALGANFTHGLPRSNADKRNAVTIALKDAEWSKLSDVKIAEMCAVARTYVLKVRHELEGTNPDVSGHSPVTMTPPPKPAYNVIPPQDEEHGEYDHAKQTLLDTQHAVSELSEENERLRDAIACGKLSEIEQPKAAETFEQLRSEIKTLTATLEAVTSMRDSLLRENAQLKAQCDIQRKAIKKLEGK